MASITVGGRTYNYTPNGTESAMQRYDIYKANADTERQNYENNLNNTLQQNNATTNANYDNAQKSAYIKYMQQQKAIPSQLQNMGVRGGASETALMNLYNNYGTNRATTEAQRNADLTKNQNSRDDAYNTYYQNYLSDLNSAQQQALADTETAYQNEITQFSSTVHQYATTKSGYDKYNAWIKQLQASSDPLKNIKIALVRQQMATQFPNGKPSSGGSGGKSSGGGSYYGDGGTAPVSSADAKNIASAASKAINSAVKATPTKKSSTPTRYQYQGWGRI